MHNAGHTYVTMVIASYGVLLIFVIMALWHQPWESRLIVKSISGCVVWHYVVIGITSLLFGNCFSKTIKTTALNALSSLTREADSSLNGVWLAGLLLFLFLS